MSRDLDEFCLNLCHMTFTTHTLIFHTTVRDIIQDNFPGNQHRDGGGGGGGERVGRVMAALSALSVKYFFFGKIFFLEEEVEVNEWAVSWLRFLLCR